MASRHDSDVEDVVDDDTAADDVTVRANLGGGQLLLRPLRPAAILCRPEIYRQQEQAAVGLVR